jgi:O-antigen/teichoic acid export membrane protein
VSEVSQRGYLCGVEGKPSSLLVPVRRVRRSENAAAAASARARGETLDQVLDRNLGELLQELRVAITGVQILFAFLLGLAFTARFGSLDRFEVAVYLVALLSTALATIVLIAPVSFHRLVFRRRQKAALVAVADRLLMTGLGLLVLAISCAVLLILDVVAGRWPGLAGGGLTALIGLLIWYMLPLWARRNGLGLADGEPAEDYTREG